MKRTLILSSLVAGCLWSCSEKPSAVETSAVPITRTELNSEVSKTVAVLTIEGMHCADGCGGKIQKELQALSGVSNTKLDFEEARADNKVSVEYDPAKTDEQKLIHCVSSIADGMYAVTSVEIVTYKGLRSHGNTSAEVSPNAFEYSRVLQLVGFLEVLASLAD